MLPQQPTSSTAHRISIALVMGTGAAVSIVWAMSNIILAIVAGIAVFLIFGLEFT